MLGPSTSVSSLESVDVGQGKLKSWAGRNDRQGKDVCKGKDFRQGKGVRQGK